MINTLNIGSHTFPVNMIQGPLAGVSSAPFRGLVWEYSKPAFSCTEMMSCKTILYQKKAIGRFIKKHPEEGPVCFQLSGRDPVELAEAVKYVTEYGADLIDLNCGCPVNKIRSRGAGSSLLKDANHLYQLIQAMKQNTHVPVSIKIRVDGLSEDGFNSEIVKAVRDGGIDCLIVHGRHWTEHYETPCHYEQIQFFVEQLDIPVIGNGDVACLSSLKRMFATGCAGVMIGRAGVGQPWLIGQLIAEMTNKTFNMPSISTIGDSFIRHINELAELLSSETFAVIHARKFAKYYARGLSNKALFCELVNQCMSISDLENIILSYFNEVRVCDSDGNGLQD